MSHLLLLFSSSLIVTLAINTAPFVWAADCRRPSSKVRSLIMVDPNGKGQFKTVQAAIDSLPKRNHDWVEIQINPGLYIEKVEIGQTRQCVFLNGRDRQTTTISYNAHSRTDESATFTSSADNVVVHGITFKNSYNRYWVTKEDVGAGAVTQALAARVYGDKSVFYNCAFVSVQDTLWDVMGRHYFYNCYIEGAVDFIFGSAQSYYENCIMNATVGLKPYNLQIGYVTAQGRQSANDPSGFVFKGGAVLGGKNVYLGRAYGPFALVIFDGTTLGDGVNPRGWDAWQYGGKEGNFFFSELSCTGGGSNLSGRVPWVKTYLRDSDRSHYSLSSFIDQEGWLAAQPLAGHIRQHRGVCPSD